MYNPVTVYTDDAPIEIYVSAAQGARGIDSRPTVSATAPANPNDGDRWYDTTTAILSTWYTDAWIQD